MRLRCIPALLVAVVYCGAQNGDAAKTAVAPPAQMASLPGTGTLGAATSDTFTFIVAGDNRPPNADSAQPPTPGQIFAAAQTVKPAFYVWTGDMIYGLDSADSVAIGLQYQAFFKLAQQAGVPVFAAPGNHEMDVKIKSDTSSLKEIGSAKMQALYRANMGLADSTQIYGAFSYANSRFILLNSEEIPPAGEVRSPLAKTDSKVNLDPGYITKAQRDWLTSELDANKATHTFVFMHHPIKPKKSDMGLNDKNAKDLIKLFGNYKNISYVLASHEHLYYNVQTGDTTSPPNRTDPSKDSASYLISGGAGAKLAGTPDKGGFHNYLIFRVMGNQVLATLVKLP